MGLGHRHSSLLLSCTKENQGQASHPTTLHVEKAQNKEGGFLEAEAHYIASKTPAAQVGNGGNMAGSTLSHNMCKGAVGNFDNGQLSGNQQGDAVTVKAIPIFHTWIEVSRLREVRPCCTLIRHPECEDPSPLLCFKMGSSKLEFKELSTRLKIMH